ncbi:MAG: DUF4826 family protein [Glaciecola sp.]|jgi:hypothetical protein
MAEEQTPQIPQNEAELGEWVRAQFQKANKHLAENGVMFESVVVEESRYMAPYLAVWKIKSNQGKFFWVMSGDLPSDYVPANVASDVQGVLKHFALAWQLKAENLAANNPTEQTDIEYIQLLAHRAEGLYAMSEDEKLWQN